MANKPRVVTLERVGEAVELRAKGRTWSEVADVLGYRSADAAESSVRKYLQRMRADTDLGQMLMQEELKLQQRERYILAAAEKVPTDDVSGRDTVDKVLDRIGTSRAKLWGLHAPKQHDVQVTAVTAEDTRARLLAVAAERDQLTARRPAAIEGEVIR
ncbi:hypothetical protein ACWDTG_12870 [Rhodococcus zopfii]